MALLDLLQAAGPPPTSMHVISTPYTSLQEELNFTQILSSCSPEPSTSNMSLLDHIEMCHEGMSSVGSDMPPVGCSNPLNTLLSQHNYPKFAPYLPPTYQSHRNPSAEPYNVHIKHAHSCNSGSETSAWPQKSLYNEAAKPSTSSITSEPSSTLENMETREIATVAYQHSQTVHTCHMQRSKDVPQHSCQTSLDEGSSMQELGLPAYVHAQNNQGGGDACRASSAPPSTAEESCSLDNCQDRRGVRHADDYASQPAGVAPRRARKRSRVAVCRNREEAESQRLTHIAVERNRRRQMNEHLNVLRSLMPETYIQRGDQASIVGGAIDFVNELEHVLQTLTEQKIQRYSKAIHSSYQQHGIPSLQEPTVEQELSSYMRHDNACSYINMSNDNSTCFKNKGVEVDVRIHGTFALVKVLTQKQPHQLLNLILSIKNFNMKILHLSITTIGKSVLYSFNLEVQGNYRFQSANGIAKLIRNIFMEENRFSS